MAAGKSLSCFCNSILWSPLFSSVNNTEKADPKSPGSVNRGFLDLFYAIRLTFGGSVVFSNIRVGSPQAQASGPMGKNPYFS